jgi:DNA-3-methyladenine glycosylase
VVRAIWAPIDRTFYERDALVVARALVGTHLVVVPERERGRPWVARIVETEAYRGPRDLACHARAGLTRRTRTLYGPPGHAYVFLIYGMHDCFNVVCFGEGKGHAVLVRAVEPVAGLPWSHPGSTAGPGRLTRALGITRRDDAVDLVSPARLFVAPRAPGTRPRMGVSARVGVAYAGEWADKPWRFFDAGSAHVSRPPKGAIGRPRSAP